jgi:VanZ family protein
MAVRNFLPALLWGLVIFIAISMPPGNIPKTGLFNIPYFDKIVHFGLFTVFGLLLSAGFFKQREEGFLRQYFILLTILTGLFYGSITEVLQHFYFTGRDGNMFDAMANLFGTVFGVILFRLLLKIKPKFFI